MTATPTCIDGCPAQAGPNRPYGGRAKGLLQLGLWMAAVLFFLLGGGPRLGDMIPAHKKISRFIEENDIEANMYFYTEVEEFSDAQINMVNTMAYPPAKETHRTTPDE